MFRGLRRSDASDIRVGDHIRVGDISKNFRTCVSHKDMKLLPSLALAVWITSSIGSSADKSRDHGPGEAMILEVTWGDPKKPECKLVGEVASDGLFAIKSHDGRHAAGGKVGTPDDKGYPVALTLFTWRSEKSNELQTLEPRINLGASHEWTTVTGIARHYRITLARATGADAGKPKTATEQDGAKLPATRPEAKPEGGGKPQPASEERSR